jgi:hypothetical protein
MLATFLPFSQTPSAPAWMMTGSAQTKIVLVGVASAHYVSGGSTVLSLDGTLTGGIGSSPIAGDLVMGIVAAGDSGSDNNCSITGDETGAYTEDVELYADDTDDTNFGLYTAIMGATPDTELTGTGYDSDGTYAGELVALVFRRVHADIFDAEGATRAGVDTSKANPQGITPVTPGAYVLFIGACVCATTSTTQPAWDNTTPLIFANSALATKGIKVLVAHAEWTSGNIDRPAWTDSDTDSTNYSYCAVPVALKPQ